MTVEVIIRTIVDNDIGVERSILAVVATDVDTTNLWDTEDDTIDERFPPNTGRSSCYRSTDYLTNLHVLILTWESAGIAVVIFANQNARRLVPLSSRLYAEIFAMGQEMRVLFAVKQMAQVVVQVTTAVMTLVDNHCIAVAVVLVQQLLVELAEAIAVH